MYGKAEQSASERNLLQMPCGVDHVNARVTRTGVQGNRAPGASDADFAESKGIPRARVDSVTQSSLRERRTVRTNGASNAEFVEMKGGPCARVEPVMQISLREKQVRAHEWSQ